ncbi:MAG: sulfatase-like hydrolase/transferase [Planctomycetota bacterium]
MTRSRPNLLLLVADHLSPRVMGAYGDSASPTPTMDAVAHRGVCFDRAYTPVPLCQPARAALWSGLEAHQTGVRSNGSPGQFPHNHWHVDQPLADDVSTLGSLLQDAGYTAVHYGKQHDRGALRGFHAEPERETVIEGDPRFPLNHDTFRDRHTAERCIDFLRRHEDGPFIAVADFNNPHNICGWIGAHAGLEDPPLDADGEDLPALPDNFAVDDWHHRPEAVAYLCCSHPRQTQAARWSPELFRYYLRAYRHYCRRVDLEMDCVLQALRQRSDVDNTVVMILADHGDGLASHGMVSKQTVLYEQFVNVPLIVAGPGVVAQASALSPLVSLLDVLPTCCELAGVAVPEDKPGRSLVPWLGGEQPVWRDAVFAQWFTEWGHTVCPARMVRTDRFKYTVYRDPTHASPQEELYDLHDDPGETRTLHHDPAHGPTLQAMRDRLAARLAETEDFFWAEPTRVHPQARQHPRGFQHHRGPSAPDLPREPEAST